MSYLAGQLTCFECGHVSMLTKHVTRAFAPVRCPDCDSTRTAIPIWWQLDDPAEIARATTRDFTRDRIKREQLGRRH